MRRIFLTLALVALVAVPAGAAKGLLGDTLGRAQEDPNVMGIMGAYATTHYIFGGGVALEGFLGLPQDEPAGNLGIAYETPDGVYIGFGGTGAGADSTVIGAGFQVGYRVVGASTGPIALYVGGEVLPLGTTDTVPYGAWAFTRFQIGPWHDLRPRFSWQPEGGFSLALELGIVGSR